MNADLLRFIMNKQGFDVPALAERLDVHPGTVYNMLAGKRVRTTTLFKLAKLLKVEIDQLAPHLSHTARQARRLMAQR